MNIVLGATGTNGRQVAQRLLATGQNVRAIVRDPGKAADLKSAGAELAIADLAKPETLAAAFKGGSALFLLSPVAENMTDLELDAISAAKAAGVGRVVKLSAIGADPLAAGHFSRSHGIVESALRDSGLGWTIVRGAFFYSNLMFAVEAIKQGVFVGHWEDRKAAWVDPQDLSAVCAACLKESKYVGNTFTATGPAALSNDDVAAKLSAALGRPIRYVNQTPDEYAKMLTTHGSPEWYAQAEVGLRQVVFSGEAALVTNAVERLTGRSPRSIEQYIDENRRAFA